MRRINGTGIELIQEFEELRLDAYQDGGGVWTIGWGHTRGVQEGDRISISQADEFFREDVNDVERDLHEWLGVEPNLTHNQFSAVGSLVFNIGIEQFSTSTMLRLLRAGDTRNAVFEFTRWTMDNGKRNLGLFRRRLAEAQLYLRA